MAARVRWVLACALGGIGWCAFDEIGRLAGLLLAGIPMGLVMAEPVLVLGHAAVALATMVVGLAWLLVVTIAVFNTELGDTTSWAWSGWAIVIVSFALFGAVLGWGHGFLLRGRKRTWALAGAMGGIPGGFLLVATIESPRPLAALAGLGAGAVYGLVTSGPAGGSRRVAQ